MTRRLRWLILGVVVLLLLWPTSKTENLIAERAARRDSVTREVLGSYGRAQTITGPILTVPYRVPEQYNRNRFKIEYARFLPASLEVRGRIDADVRHRSIFEVPVYVAEVELRGHFDPPTVKAPAFDNAPDNAPGNAPGNASDNASDKPANPSSGAKPDNIVWDQATVAAELSDKKGLMEPIVFQAMGKRFTLETGDDGANPFKHGMLATIDSALAKNGMDFTMRVKARGGERFAVLPVGGETKMNLTSSWLHPAFDGGFLPISHVETETGFSADWSVLRFARDFPQSWTNKKLHELTRLECGAIKRFRPGYGVADDGECASLGVSFVNPTDQYSLVSRSIRYATFFLVITLLVLHLWELTGKTMIHPLQYLLVGCGLSLFYVLELALAEHMAFWQAYLIASAAITLLLGLYSGAMLSTARRGGLLAGMLAGLFTYLYITLTVEDHALLLGAIALLGLLVAVMFATRRMATRTTPPVPATEGDR